jgi:hypothetical protein
MGAVLAASASMLRNNRSSEYAPLLHHHPSCDDDNVQPPIGPIDMVFHACPISKAFYELACFFALELPRCPASQDAYEWLAKARACALRATVGEPCTDETHTLCFTDDALEQPKKAVSKRIAMLAQTIIELPPTRQRVRALEHLHEARAHALIAVDWVNVPR